MSVFRDDPRFWRFHAEEARIKLRQINNPERKRAMKEVAAEYERIACRIEERVCARVAPVAERSARS
jgi:hypothetical protein